MSNQKIIFDRPSGNAGRFTARGLISIAVVTFLVLSFIASYWADWAWYDSVGRTDVFTKQLILKAAIFLVATALTFVLVWGSARFAYAKRPLVLPTTPEEMVFARYREALDPFRRAIFIIGPAVFAALIGLAAASEWQTFLLWQNSTPFGTVDAQFGRDISFFTFTLPFLQTIVGFGFTILIVMTITNVAIHYVYGGFRIGRAQAGTSAARTQLMILLGIFALLKAVAYYLDRFALASRDGALISGLKYADVHALVPAKNILTYIALATAILFFASLFRPGWSLPFIALGSMLGASILIGGIYPAFVQQVQVKPSELQRETPYIQRNIEATRQAFGLANVQISEYQAIDNPSQATLEKDAGTLANVRLLDPSVVSPTFRNLQQIRSFYAFPDSLDIDRYTIDGKKRGTVLAVRDVNLAGVSASQRNWFNDHMVFTHGYGVVSAYDNTANADGEPAFLESDIPPSGKLNIDQPRVYFGESSPNYSIVGAPASAEPRELDYPDDKSDNGQTNNTYSGTGGVPMGNFFQRLIFALHYREANIVLSNQINSESKILYDRDPQTRVLKVAPWLTLDEDPYPVVVDGKITWVVDGYTTSNEYPYAARVSLRDATADSVTADTADEFLIDSRDVNYMRNSVKATVDAYNGTVTIYAWDETDPVLKTWSKAFPGVVQPKASIPAGVLEHVRYPEDMFKVQRGILAKYHVKDPQAFYSGQDFWNIPDDPTKPTVKQAQPPYYLTLQMPDQKAPTFSLTSTFAPNKRQTLAAFMAVNSDPGPDYGTIRVLQLPRNTTIPGPTQVQNNFESDPDVSAKLSLLRKGGSEVTLGNLLSLPVGGGLLYVEPVYIQASAGEGYPLLRKVLVSFGSKVAFEDDLAAALNVVFADTAIPGTPEEPETPGTGGTTTPSQALAKAIADANKAYADGEAALAKGDFAAYGAAQDKLAAALKRVTEASAKLNK